MWWQYYVKIVFLVLCAVARIKAETQHRTKAASEKQHDLWCYKCDTMLDGEKCLDLTTNSTQMHVKCHKEQKKCQVRRISVSTSTDEVTGKPKLWWLTRECSEACEPGCIIIGERTKLHSCVTCCDEGNYCNFGSGSVDNRCAYGLLLGMLILGIVQRLKYSPIFQQLI